MVIIELLKYDMQAFADYKSQLIFPDNQQRITYFCTVKLLLKSSTIVASINKINIVLIAGAAA